MSEVTEISPYGSHFHIFFRGESPLNLLLVRDE
jgi:hypothetical protein